MNDLAQILRLGTHAGGLDDLDANEIAELDAVLKGGTTQTRGSFDPRDGSIQQGTTAVITQGATDLAQVTGILRHGSGA